MVCVVNRDLLARLKYHANLQMVLQIGTDAKRILHDRDTMILK